MKQPIKFTVEFGRIARTIIYKDSDGQILFTLDSSLNGKKWIILEHHSSDKPREPRYEFAFEHTKEYLQSSGFQVEVYDPPPQKSSQSCEDVISIVHHDEHGKIILHFKIQAKDGTRKTTKEFWRADLLNKQGRFLKDDTIQEQRRLARALKKVQQFLEMNG
jgi:hypothetical protein